MPNIKKCSKCGVEKSISEFYKDKRGKYGVRSQCKECLLQQQKEYDKEHKEERKEYDKEHKEERKKYTKEYNKQYHAKPEIKIKINKRYNNRRASDPIFRLKDNISRSLSGALKRIGSSKNGQPTFEILGFTKKQFNEQLDSYLGQPCERCGKITITNNNSHIDHILPISLAKTKEEIIQFNQLNNLRLVCELCNVKKNNKLDFDNATLPEFADFYINRAIITNNE